MDSFDILLVILAFNATDSESFMSVKTHKGKGVIPGKKEGD